MDEGKLESRLARLYGAEVARELAPRLIARLHPDALPPRPLWDERDVVLITYGDSISAPGEPPLQTLRRFCRQRLWGLISTIHILPFFPYSSDDGFSVADYRAVHPMLGDWDDVKGLSDDFDLTFDFVLNHVSSRSDWFKQFLGDRPPGRDYFIVIDGDEVDLSGVVRPRVRPLLAEFETEEGPRRVWATFSEDQLDLNYENPELLLEMVDIFQDYLLRGARVVRLDAVAFLWKRIGTPCIHLEETHEVVKLLRDVAQTVAPGSLVLTETNVPHRENVSYFGAGDEAHVVYQFSLPPLLLHALHTGSARYLTRWSASLQPAPRGCTYLNFTASHDGIGLRPVEGILPHDEVDALVTGMQSAGGYGSFRDLGGGRRAVYELNITYFDALRGTAEHREDGLQVPRFVCSQLVALSLQGIPALYVQSVIATENDHERVDQIGAFRAINRTKWALPHVEALLDDPTAPQHHVYRALRHALSVRRQLPAFHPDVRQRTLPLGDDIFAIERLPDEGEPVLVLTNVTAEPVAAPLPPAYRGMPLRNALTDVTVDAGQSHYELDRYQVAWIVRQP